MIVFFVRSMLIRSTRPAIFSDVVFGVTSLVRHLLSSTTSMSLKSPPFCLLAQQQSYSEASTSKTETSCNMVIFGFVRVVYRIFRSISLRSFAWHHCSKRKWLRLALPLTARTRRSRSSPQRSAPTVARPCGHGARGTRSVARRSSLEIWNYREHDKSSRFTIGTIVHTYNKCPYSNVSSYTVGIEISENIKKTSLRIRWKMLPFGFDAGELGSQKHHII